MTRNDWSSNPEKPLIKIQSWNEKQKLILYVKWILKQWKGSETTDKEDITGINRRDTNNLSQNLFLWKVPERPVVPLKAVIHVLGLHEVTGNDRSQVKT